MSIRRTVELHDSRLLELHQSEGDLVIVFDAYVHRENDELDVDAGRWTGWRQKLALTLKAAAIEGASPRAPSVVEEGELLTVAPRHERRFAVLPLPFALDSGVDEVSLWLECRSGELLVRAKSLALKEVEDARFVERNTFGV